MKRFSIALVFVVLLHVTAVNALECYTCSTTKDWDKCDDIKQKTKCSASSLMRCMKAEVHAKGNGIAEDAYVKTCATQSTCSAKNLPKCNTKISGVKIDCKVDCCDGDLCNTGAVPLVSGVVILACAVYSVWIVL